MHRAAAVVELAAAVIGDIDPLDAVIDSDLGVLCGGDALDHQRDFVLSLMRFTVRQSSAIWYSRPLTSRRLARTKRLARSRSRRL